MTIIQNTNGRDLISNGCYCFHVAGKGWKRLDGLAFFLRHAGWITAPSRLAVEGRVK